MRRSCSVLALLTFASLACESRDPDEAKPIEAFRVIPMDKRATENPFEVAVAGGMCTHSVQSQGTFASMTLCEQFIQEKRKDAKEWETFECHRGTPVCNR